MTDKLAGPDIVGQTSKACILSELSKETSNTNAVHWQAYKFI